MDYEKKYKEALNKAKDLYGKYCINNILEDLFPELKGEGKKNEKSRIGIIKAVAKFEWGDFKAQDILEWLEKKKEN